MRNLSLFLLIPLAAACTSMAPPVEAIPVGSCSAETLSSFTGQTVDEPLTARMMRETGRKMLRLVRPGMAVTMDYREDRLTVYVDAANKVERASCS
ncbi:MAG: I78 family peptidase inhibitor [Pseudomonadota bacterium]